MLGKASIAFVLFFSGAFSMILIKSNGAFTRSQMALEINLPKENIDERALIKQALRERFPEVKSVSEKLTLSNN